MLGTMGSLGSGSGSTRGGVTAAERAGEVFLCWRASPDARRRHHHRRSFASELLTLAIISTYTRLPKLRRPADIQCRCILQVGSDATVAARHQRAKPDGGPAAMSPWGARWPGPSWPSPKPVIPGQAGGRPALCNLWASPKGAVDLPRRRFASLTQFDHAVINRIDKLTFIRGRHLRVLVDISDQLVVFL